MSSKSVIRLTQSMYTPLFQASLCRCSTFRSLPTAYSQRTLHRRTLLLRTSGVKASGHILKRHSSSTSSRAARPFSVVDTVKGEKRSKNTRLHTKQLRNVSSGPVSAQDACPEPLAAVKHSQLSILDPTGARTKLFARKSPEAANVGDVLLVKQKSGDPYAGVCIDIRRRGIDTSICLRNSLTRVGVEVWFKIYSPAVEAIEVVRRKQKRARRARLYYMRHPKHDLGSVSNIVHRYQNEKRSLLGNSPPKGRDANSRARSPKNARK